MNEPQYRPSRSPQYNGKNKQTKQTMEISGHRNGVGKEMEENRE